MARECIEHYFQPHIDVRTSKIIEAEALLHWRHATEGLLLPLTASQGMFLENIGVARTETVSMHDVGSVARTVRQLQDMVVCVAIDDFGTGFSSLSMLKRLSFDIIKIDCSFISGVWHRGSDAARRVRGLAVRAPFGAISA